MAIVTVVIIVMSFTSDTLPPPPPPVQDEEIIVVPDPLMRTQPVDAPSPPPIPNPSTVFFMDLFGTSTLNYTNVDNEFTIPPQ